MTSPLVSIRGLEKRFDLSGSLLEQITFEGGVFAANRKRFMPSTAWIWKCRRAKPCA